VAGQSLQSERFILRPPLETRYGNCKGTGEWTSHFRDFCVQRNRVAAEGLAVTRGVRRYGLLSVLRERHWQQRAGREPEFGCVANQGHIP